MVQCNRYVNDEMPWLGFSRIVWMMLVYRAYFARAAGGAATAPDKVKPPENREMSR